MRHLIRLSLFVIPAALAAQTSAKPIAPRLIAAPESRSPATLGSPVAVRQLPSGALLVNDTQRRQLLLFDPSLRSVTVVADSAAGSATSYGARAGGIIPYLADSTLFVDPDGL